MKSLRCRTSMKSYDQALTNLANTEPKLDEETIKLMSESKFPPNIVSLQDFAKLEPNYQNILDSKIFEANTDEERLDIYQDYFLMRPIRPQDLKNTTKYNGWARSLRFKGTGEFNKKNWTAALRFYNLSLVFAPFTTTGGSFGFSPEIAMAFANRASVLLELHEPGAAMEDVKRALQHGYADREKMEARMKKCIQKKLDMAKFIGANQHLIDEQKRRLNYRQNFIFKLKQPGTELPMAENFVQIVNADEESKFRTVVVTQHVPAGTTLIVEDPFVVGLHRAYQWDFAHCHYCFQITHNPIPCKGCVFAVYCDQTCADKAFEEYHRYECRILPNLAVLDTPRDVLTAFKSVMTVGPKRLYEIFKSRDPAYLRFENPDDEVAYKYGIRGRPRSKVESYSSTSYQAYFHLMSHPDENCPFDLDEIQQNYLRAIQFVEALVYCTNFFDEITFEKNGVEKVDEIEDVEKILKNLPLECEKKKFENFVMAVTLRHIKAVAVNRLYLEETSGWEGVSLRRMGNDSNQNQLTGNRLMLKYGTAVYNLSSLLSHSCDPTARRVTDLKGGTHAVISIRPLKPGDEITIAYDGLDYRNETLAFREHKLKTIYHFNCKCVACLNEWPMINGWITKTQRGKVDFICPKETCHGILVENEKVSSKKKIVKKVKGQKLDVDPEVMVGVCGTCGESFPLEKLKEEWLILFKKFQDAGEYFAKNQPLEAVDILKQFLDFGHKNISYPYPELCYASDTLMRCIFLIIYFSEGKYF